MSDVSQNVDDGAQDESELDAALESSLAAVKAGETLGVTQPSGEAAPTGQTGEPGPTGSTGADAPTGATGPSGGSAGEGDTGVPSATGAAGEDSFRIPNKGKFETDEGYEKRIELFELVKRRRATTDPAAKAALSEQIKTAKGELKTLGGPERFIQPKDETAPQGATGQAGASGDEDPDLAADQERLRALGGATKRDVAELIAQERHDAEVRSNLNTFVGAHSELKDEDVREVFFDFVESNYNWQGKSGDGLKNVLEMAYDAYFKPAESMQDRVLKAADVQGKVNAMQFPGGTGSKNLLPAEMQKDIEALKATGMSEEKAIELLSD